MTRQLLLSRGMCAVLDDEDYDRVAMHGWKAKPARQRGYRFYACRTLREVGTRATTTLYLHRVLLAAPTGLLVDHRNGDSLDCRRSNLRLATHTQNITNKNVENSTGFRGVYAQSDKFVARISSGERRHKIGVFATPELAAAAYDHAALEAFGEFARLNFPSDWSRA